MKMTVDEKIICPYCHREMTKWACPPESTWGEGVHYICFNDECSYYVRGWAWMMEKYAVHASYRYHFNPITGERGPIPVWDGNALKNAIIED